MNLHHTSSLRLPGRRLLFVRALWIAGVVAVLVIFCASIPTYFASLHVLAPQIAPREVRLTQDGLHALHALHLSIDLYAVFSIVLFVLFVLGFVLVGAVLFWRKAADRLALLTSFALITFPIGFISYQLETLPPAW